MNQKKIYFQVIRGKVLKDALVDEIKAGDVFRIFNGDQRTRAVSRNGTNYFCAVEDGKLDENGNIRFEYIDVLTCSESIKR